MKPNILHDVALHYRYAPSDELRTSTWRELGQLLPPTLIHATPAARLTPETRQFLWPHLPATPTVPGPPALYTLTLWDTVTDDGRDGPRIIRHVASLALPDIDEDSLHDWIARRYIACCETERTCLEHVHLEQKHLNQQNALDLLAAREQELIQRGRARHWAVQHDQTALVARIDLSLPWRDHHRQARARVDFPDWTLRSWPVGEQPPAHLTDDDVLRARDLINDLPIEISPRVALWNDSPVIAIDVEELGTLTQDLYPTPF